MKFIGSIKMLGDKSIAHRVLIISSWFKGFHSISNFPENEDILTTLHGLSLYGLKYSITNKVIKIDSTNFSFNEEKINCNDSGTSARLFCGYLAGANVKAQIFGSKSLSIRPMDRVVEPLNSFGANIKSTKGLLPLHITPSSNLGPFKYDLKIASAQVKSSLILYAMFIKGVSTITGLIHTRNHLENLLSYFGYPITCDKKQINIKGRNRISKNLIVDLPGDISSASFIIAGAILLKDSSIKIKNICFNKYRIGFMQKLIDMGGNITFSNKKSVCGEDVVDIHVKYSPHLMGAHINKKEIPFIIDEIPILCVVASYAKSQTVIEGIDELKIKESNRVEAILLNIDNMGGIAEVVGDNLIITPKNKLHNTTINSFNDHRIFMSFYIANLVAEGIFNKNSINPCYKKSFIDFFDILEEIIE